MPARRSVVLIAVGLLNVAGCLSPVRQETDALVCSRANVRIDALPTPATILEQLPEAKGKELTKGDVTTTGLQQIGGVVQPDVLSQNELELARKKAAEQFLNRLQVPPLVPGGGALKIERPKGFEKLPPAEQDKFLAKYFPPMLPMGPDPQPIPGPNGQPLTLEDLQRLARENSPLLRQAASDIKAVEGAAWEAGMYPNPTIGLSSNSIGPNGGPLMGPYIQQTIKTGGKLKLSQSMALMDVANAQVAYRRAETDLMASVRTGYYAVLVAEASIKANHAVADLTDEVYKIMLLYTKVGTVATYEPMQIAVFAAQARIALVQSRNSYLVAWKQLGAALGLPAMPPTQLAGNLDQHLPRFDFEKCLARILANHTDVVTANNALQKMRYNLRLSEVTPIPDVTVGATLMYDATPPGPPRWVTFFTGNMPIPVWDRNQGGIKQAQGQLMRASEEPHRVRAALTASVADAFNRLETNRILLEMYVKQMLPQQVNAFRATVLRHAFVADVVFNDLIAAEQNLVSLIPTYLTTLGAYWQAVSDIASLLQTDNVYLMAEEVSDASLPNLAELLKLPCCHPCSSLPQAEFKGISSFESPPGLPVSPEIRGVETSPAAAPKTPAAPKESSALPTPAITMPPTADAAPTAAPLALPPALLTPIALPASATSTPARQ
jgi:outer membrane protein, heavy metal efflux system